MVHIHCVPQDLSMWCYVGSSGHLERHDSRLVILLLKLLLPLPKFYVLLSHEASLQPRLHDYFLTSELRASRLCLLISSCFVPNKRDLIRSLTCLHSSCLLSLS